MRIGFFLFCSICLFFLGSVLPVFALCDPNADPNESYERGTTWTIKKEINEEQQTCRVILYSGGMNSCYYIDGISKGRLKEIGSYLSDLKGKAELWSGSLSNCDQIYNDFYSDKRIRVVQILPSFIKFDEPDIETKILPNQAPSLEIIKIKRVKIVNNKEKEVEITKNNEYKDEFDRIYPGDKIFYKTVYTNNSSLPNKEIGIYAAISSQAEDWGEVISGNEKSLNGTNRSNDKDRIIWKYYDIIGSKESIEPWIYWVQLKKEIPWLKEIKKPIKFIQTKATIQEQGFNYQNFTEISNAWIDMTATAILNNDLWHEFNGQITGPYGKIDSNILETDKKPIPDIGLSVYDEKDKLILGRDVKDINLKEKETIKTDERGNYDFDINRDWLGNNNSITIKVFFDNRNLSKEGEMNFPLTFYFSDNKPAYFSFKVDINNSLNKGVFNQDIKIRRDEKETTPTWDYPTDPQLIKEVKLHSEVFANLYFARKILKDEEIEDTKGDKLNITVGTSAEQIGGEAKFISPNTIEMSKSNYEFFATRKPTTELHEFAHFLQDKLNLTKPSYFMGDLSRYPWICPPGMGLFCIYENHYGYANSTTHDSYIEGMADFIANFLDNEIISYFKDDEKWDNVLHASSGGMPILTFDAINPIFGQIGTSGYYDNEENAAATLLGLLTGISNLKTNNAINYRIPNSDLAYLNCDKSQNPQYYLGPFIQVDKNKIKNNVKSLFNILKDKKPKNLSDLFNAYKDNNLLQDGVNDIGLNFLQQIYLISGVFNDKNSDWCYQKDESIGYNGNSKKFEIIPLGTQKKIQIDARSSRFHLLIPNSFIKFDFLDDKNNSQDLNKVTVEIKSLADNYINQDYSYKYEFLAGKDEFNYFTMPLGRKSAKIYLTAEGSSDYAVINSDNYWKKIEAPDNKNYFSIETFKINGSKAPIDQSKENKNISQTILYFILIGVGLLLVGLGGRYIYKYYQKNIN